MATAGGLTSGIDLALHIVERYYGQEVAQAPLTSWSMAASFGRARNSIKSSPLSPPSSAPRRGIGLANRRTNCPSGAELLGSFKLRVMRRNRLRSPANFP